MERQTIEGVFVALLPQRGSALVELLRDACRQALEAQAAKGWGLELGPLTSPAGAIAFRLVSPTETFPWRDAPFAELARAVSRLGPGRCWALALDRSGPAEGWAEALIFDRGDRVGGQEAHGAEAAREVIAWFAEQLAVGEPDVEALFSVGQLSAGVDEPEGQGGDEIEQILERARREFAVYQQLKQRREQG